MIELVRRAWAHRKLRKGQCRWCGTVLPDDAATRFCGESCAYEYEQDKHPVI